MYTHILKKTCLHKSEHMIHMQAYAHVVIDKHVHAFIKIFYHKVQHKQPGIQCLRFPVKVSVSPRSLKNIFHPCHLSLRLVVSVDN